MKNIGKMLLGLGLFLVSATAQAEWSFRPQVGLGYTDNANYEATAKNADTFWWVRSSSSYIMPNSQWNLWLNYRDYFKESQNDVLTYRLGRTEQVSSLSLGKFDWDIAFGGQQYLNENPGTTEASFNNFYLETSLAKTKALKPSLELSWGPLYSLTSFPSLNGRIDHTLLFNAGLDWTINSVHSLAPYADLGYVVSNQALYSKQYFEFGTDWRIQADPSLKYIFRFVSKFSSFPNRLITDATAVTNKNGRVVTTSRDEIETQTFSQIQGTVAKLIGSAELRGTLGLNTQSTRSGVEDYNEMQILGALLIPLISSF